MAVINTLFLKHNRFFILAIHWMSVSVIKHVELMSFGCFCSVGSWVIISGYDDIVLLFFLDSDVRVNCSHVLLEIILSDILFCNLIGHAIVSICSTILAQ